MAKVGCPSKFNRVVASLIISDFRNGLSRKEIVLKAGIKESTLSEWIDQNKEFSKSITKAMDKFFQHGPEESIKKLIDGYVQVTKTTYKKLDKDTGEMVVAGEEVQEKHIGPDYKAIRFCLQNRYRKKWNRKQNNFTVDVTSLSDKDLRDLAKEAIKAVEGK